MKKEIPALFAACLVLGTPGFSQKTMHSTHSSTNHFIAKKKGNFRTSKFKAKSASVNSSVNSRSFAPAATTAHAGSKAKLQSNTGYNGYHISGKIKGPSQGSKALIAKTGKNNSGNSKHTNSYHRAYGSGGKPTSLYGASSKSTGKNGRLGLYKDNRAKKHSVTGFSY